MKPAPEFAPYPAVQPPAYRRWLTAGIVSLVSLSSVGALLRPFPGQDLAVVALLFATALSALALLLRVLHYRFSHHTAQCYEASVQQVQQAWWSRHRQNAALIDAVLLGPPCSRPEHRMRLFDPSRTAPTAQVTAKGLVLRVGQIFGTEFGERERQLAKLLVVKWQEQSPQLGPVRITHCYWQGSSQAWQAFVDQMWISFPQVRLPDEPVSWEGIRSFDSIIDVLQKAPSESRILCAGCESSVARHDAVLPAGEAALLWLMAAKGGVRFFRGEWFEKGGELLQAVAKRAMDQGALESSVAVCISFCDPAMSVAGTGWPIGPHRQGIYFGALPGLGGMVAQTLAAWYAETYGEPCAWLADDAVHTLALGVVGTP